MSWDPEKAAAYLASLPAVSKTGETTKLVSYKTVSGREFALIKENQSKVSVYASAFPSGLADVRHEKTYLATATKRGRHAHLDSLTRTLGFSSVTYRMNVVSQAGMDAFIGWYA